MPIDDPDALSVGWSYNPAACPPVAALVCLECGAVLDHDQADKHDCPVVVNLT